MKRDQYQQSSLENWDKALNHALKNLPERPAPADLLPQVMARINEGAVEKQNQRLWRLWPLWLRVTVSASSVALMVWLSLLGTRFYEAGLSPALSRIADICRTVFVSLAGSLGGIPFVIDGEVFRILLMIATLYFLGMYLTCIGVGTFIYRTVRR